MIRTKREFSLEYPYNMLCSIFGISFSTNEEITSDAVLSRLEIVPDTDFIASIEYLVNTLPSRCSEVMKLRYQNHLTIEETRKHMGVSRCRVEQLVNKSLRIMSTPDCIKYIKYGGISTLVNRYLTASVKGTPVSDEYLSTRALNLSAHTYNCLMRGGLRSIKEITNASFSDLRKIRNLGKHGILEVVQALDKLGLSVQGTTSRDLKWLHVEKRER